MAHSPSFAMVQKQPLSRITNKSAKAVFVSLCSFRNTKTGLCCPTLEQIASDAKVSIRSVSRCLGYLKDKGVLKICKGAKNLNKYLLIGYSSHDNLKSSVMPIGMSSSANLAQSMDNLAGRIIKNNNNNNNNNSSSLTLLQNEKQNPVSENLKNDDDEFYFLFFREILKEYNKLLSDKLGKAIVHVTKERLEAIKKSIKILGTIDEWQSYFKQVANTGFLLGKGKNGFKACLDWLIVDDNIVKVREYKYETADEKIKALIGELSEMIKGKKAQGYEVDSECLLL